MVILPLALLVAYAVDRTLGEPPDRLHPVAWMGTAIARGRDWALSAGRVGQLVKGAIVALVVPSVSAAIAYAVLRAVDGIPLVLFAVSVLLVKPTFAVRALGQAAYAVRDALDRGDLEAARRGLGSLCSRKADALGAEELVAATIESVAENASDSIVAPFFFLACFGIPGAVFYRAVNTLDAMIGYRGRFEYVGKCAARLDDLLNLLPARLTAVLLLAGGAFTGAGADVKRGMAVLARDGARTESPNAGRPMAAMAGMLRIRLVKEGHYALGDAHRPATTADITTAWRVTSLASAGALALALAATWARHG